MKLCKLLVSFLVLVSFRVANASKILFIEAMCAHSHYTLGVTIANELAARGHQVTLIAAYKQEKPHKNLKEIFVDSCATLAELKDDLYQMGQMSYWGQMKLAAKFGYTYTELVLKDPQIQNLLNSREQFDLVIAEHFFNEAFFIFPYKFKCPSVILAPGPMTVFTNHLMGNPAPSSYVPSILADYGIDMDFWQRMKNTYINLLGDFFVHFDLLPNMDKILQKQVPDAPKLTNIIYNTSLMLLSSHSSFGNPVPLQPNIKEIGGHHILPPKELPKDIKEFLDSAKEGVVLFSMGSNLKSADFPEEKKKAILKAFSKIKQKVLWKFEADLPNKPSNVKISKWLPQKDYHVLAHPNVVAFISHVGLLGTLEAVHAGVPILGLPVFWDQVKNIDDAVRKGFAVRLNFYELNEKSFDVALTEILNNPKYRLNAKRRSQLMRDQPMKQMDEAIFWIEYVIRNQGAYHLRSSAVRLKWYQRYLVDVFAFVGTISAVLLLILYKVLGSMVRSSKKSVKHILAIIGYGSASKILFVEAICVHSHYTLGSAIAKELAAKGHQVTLIAGYKQKEKQKNLQEMGQKSYWNFLDVTAGFGYSYSEKVLQNPQIQKLLNSSEHFDLVITEHFFNEALYIFPHKFKCPSVTLVAGPITMFNNYMMGNPAPSSYVPNILTGYGPDMDFWRRMKNIYVNLLGDFFIHYNLLPNMDKIIQKHVPGAPALTDIIYDTSIMLLYSHSGFEDPVPLQPNIKEIGGVILFSMGSILKSADFSEYKINAVLNVFSKLKQKVLWKFEGDLSNIPSNVKIMKWLPQRDVLAHPNVVAFISHVGLLGTFEAIYSGVPILGLPVFWDQAKNADNAVRKGIALKLNFFELNEESFDEALAEILNNPKYRDNARRLSHLIRDQPMKQMDEAIFWIEYAIRNNGSHHLRSSAVQLKWYQIYLIDVFVFVFVTLGILVLISYKLIRLLFSMRHIKPIEAIKKNK
nr:unnamed protein product [Callosobruchus chinensis]